MARFKLFADPTARAAAFAASGYLLVLLLGFGVSAAFAGGESTQDLGIAAVTLMVLAPIGSIAGAYVGYSKMPPAVLKVPERNIFWSATVLVATASIAALMGQGGPVAAMTGLIGVALLLVLRTALVQHQGSVSGQPGSA